VAPKNCRQIDPKNPRGYRERVKSPDLVKFRLTLKETDLLISAEKDLTREALAIVWRYRNQIEKYIAQDPLFKESLVPMGVDALAPPIVKEMAAAGREAGVGPMAAVAGAIAEFVGRDLLGMSSQIIVENGGDIFLSTKIKRKISIFTEKKSLPAYVDFWIDPEKTPLGICTSSGTEGPSLSLGRADAVMVISSSAAIADAMATAAGNRVHCRRDIQKVLDFLRATRQVMAGAVFVEGEMGFWGDLELAE
jgi:ApbE superfamily uncharacterized protein (UPF0280 family)